MLPLSGAVFMVSGIRDNLPHWVPFSTGGRRYKQAIGTHLKVTRYDRFKEMIVTKG